MVFRSLMTNATEWIFIWVFKDILLGEMLKSYAQYFCSLVFVFLLLISYTFWVKFIFRQTGSQVDRWTHIYI